MAIAAIVLWIVGIEFLPNVHLALHDHDHTHNDDGTIVTVRFGGSHRHDDGTEHEHGAERVYRSKAKLAAKQAPDRQTFDDPPSHHAAAGIAHRLLAFHEAEPPPVAPPHVPHATESRASEPSPIYIASFVTGTSARGPPANSSH